MADTLPELADDLDAIALSIEHNPSPTYRFKQLTGTHLRDIADSLRNHARKAMDAIAQKNARIAELEAALAKALEGAAAGPTLTLYRSSASPAAEDDLLAAGRPPARRR